MKIKTRLQIAVILTLIISVTIGLFIFSTYREMNEWNQKEIIADSISMSMAELKIITHEYLLHPGERSLMQWKASRGSLAKLLAEEANIFEDSGEKDALKKILESLERFSDIFAELAAIQGEEREYSGHHKNGISKLKVKLTGNLLVESQAMVSLAFLVHHTTRADLVSVQRKTGLLTVILFIVFAGLVSAISLWISRGIGAPITRLEEGIRIIGAGDLDHRVGTDAKDEIGHLSRTFDGMMEDLKKSTASIDDLNREIDARKKTEAALRESEVRFRELFENMRSGVAVYEVVDDGKDFVFKDFNKGAEKIDGVSREAVVGKRVTEAFPGVKEAGIFKTFQRVWRTGKPEYFPDAMYSDERIIGWRENNIYKLPSGEVVAIYDDITERRQTEEALRKSEERYRELINGMSDTAWVIDFNANFIDVNDAAVEVSGYSREELLSIGPQNIDTSINAEEIKGLIEQMPTDEIQVFETTHTTKDGKTIPVEVKSSLITYHGKQVILSIARDITNSKRAEEEIKSHQEHLAFINQILRHDLTNDLVVIQSALNLYNNSPEEEFLEEISSHAKKSIELINRMRGLESFISRHSELKMYKMKEVIDKVIKNYPFIDFKVKGKAQVMADDSLSSVIDNIIRNAVVHGKADRITITTGKKRDMCEVRFADNGTGIIDEIKERIFEEGFVHGDTGHTGIGLHIVKKAMESYGGYAWVEDNDPKGAVFVLRFRRVK